LECLWLFEIGRAKDCGVSEVLRMDTGQLAVHGTASVARKTLPLTARQIECLRWAQEGKTAWEIGQILGISARTVESYLAIAFERLDVRTRVQAVLRARALGLI
jgi:DNA-binding CsgD family transcriptional regulator